MSFISYFHTEQAIDKNELEAFLTETFGVSYFIWVEDFYEYLVTHEIEEEQTYIGITMEKTGFRYGYDIFNRGHAELKLRTRIDSLKKLAIRLEISILASDDEIAPYSYVLIEPTGETSTIMIEWGDELVVKGVYNFPWGYFRTKERLSGNELHQLRELSKIYPELEINYDTDGPVTNGNFNKVRAGIEQLRQFDHLYELRPTGKNIWHTLDEKAQLFMECMNDFQKAIKKDLCVFTRQMVGAKEEQNTEEEYCEVLSSKGQERIVYYRRSAD